jgi:hypothetical protein
LLYLGAFFGSKLFDDYSHANQSYKFFIDTFLYYQRLFEYNGDIQDILDMPYCLYQDTIIEQVKLKKKENKDKEEKMRQVQSRNKTRR